nr:polyketide synthase [Angustibacter aerolatus]
MLVDPDGAPRVQAGGRRADPASGVSITEPLRRNESAAFEPVAIVGRGCVLPDALDPETFWHNVRDGRSSLGPVPEGRWRLDRERATGTVDDHLDRTWTDVGGYVRGFDEVFDPSGLLVPAGTFDGLDPLFAWVVQGCGRRCARRGSTARPTARAWCSATCCAPPTSAPATPSTCCAGSTRRPCWPGCRCRRGRRPTRATGSRPVCPPSLAAQALGLGAGGFSVEAACASSLYAVRLACERLHEGSADVVVAGGVNRIDNLFQHVGFCGLNAVSRSGRSRPLHREADGLLHGEGAAFVALMRLSDALATGTEVLAVVRGIGLSNDGRGQGLLSPTEEGQQRAMRLAYEPGRRRPGDGVARRVPRDRHPGGRRGRGAQHRRRARRGRRRADRLGEVEPRPPAGAGRGRGTAQGGGRAAGRGAATVAARRRPAARAGRHAAAGAAAGRAVERSAPRRGEPRSASAARTRTSSSTRGTAGSRRPGAAPARPARAAALPPWTPRRWRSSGWAPGWVAAAAPTTCGGLCCRASRLGRADVVEVDLAGLRVPPHDVALAAPQQPARAGGGARGGGRPRPAARADARGGRRRARPDAGTGRGAVARAAVAGRRRPDRRRAGRAGGRRVRRPRRAGPRRRCPAEPARQPDRHAPRPRRARVRRRGRGAVGAAGARAGRAGAAPRCGRRRAGGGRRHRLRPGAPAGAARPREHRAAR